MVSRPMSKAPHRPAVNADIQPIAERGTPIDRALAERLVETGRRSVRIRPFVSDEIVYLSADVEDELYIAQANSRQ